jgi:hypothetical protein
MAYGASPPTMSSASAKKRVPELSTGNCRHKTAPVLIQFKWTINIYIDDWAKRAPLSTNLDCAYPDS